MFTSFILVISIALLTLPCIEGQSVHLFTKGNGISRLFPNGVNDFLMARDQQYVYY